MLKLAILTTCLLAAGCQSKEEKAARLRRQMDEACYGVVMANLRGGSGSPEDHAKCDVATREFNRFMD